MKKRFVFLALLAVVFPLTSVFADTVFGMFANVYRNSVEGACAAYTPDKKQLWVVSYDNILIIDRNNSTTQLKSISAGNHISCAFDLAGNFWYTDENRVCRINPKNGDTMFFDNSKASALGGINRRVKYDPVSNRVIIVGVKGTCFANLNSAGEVVSWEDFPNVGLKKSGVSSDPNVMLYKDEIWVVCALAYCYKNGEWKTYDTVEMHSPKMVSGSAMDKEGNIYAGNKIMVKWTRSTNTWSQVLSVPNDYSVSIGIDGNQNMIYAGIRTFGKVNLSDMSVDTFTRSVSSLAWDFNMPEEDVPVIDETPDSGLLIVGQNGIVELGGSASHVRAPMPTIYRGSVTASGLFSLSGRKIGNFSTNQFGAKVSAGAYLVQYGEKSGKKTYVNKTISVR